MKLNNRFIYGTISIILAAVIAFVAIPAVAKKTNSTTQIVRVTVALERGEVVTSNAVEEVTVGGYNLPSGIVSNTEDVVGTYAVADLFPGDYILSNKVSPTPLSSDLALNNIPNGHVAISITAQTLASGLSDKLQSGDIVRLYHYNDKTDALFPVEDIPELRFIKVLSLSDAGGHDIDYAKESSKDEERRQTATITLLATPEQAMLLTQYENEGVLHIALVSRGDEKLSDDLLILQKNILTELYGSGIEENENQDAPQPENSENVEAPQSKDGR